MPWIDITRNLETGNRERVIDLFEFNDTLYAIVKTYNAIPTDQSAVFTFDPGTYKVVEHLGADPPVVDIIWGQAVDFPVFPTDRGYIPAGHAEDSGLIHIGNADAGVVYVNSTSNVIDGNWTVLSGPFGLDQFVDKEAGLRDLIFYNNKLYAAHLGGVSAFNPKTKIWDIVGMFTASPGSFGQVTGLFGFQGELYVTVSYGDIGKVHKYNATVRKPEDWILVGELPLDSLEPFQLAEYNNALFLITGDPNRNIFDLTQIDTTLTGQPRFIGGDHLAGVPTSIIKYRKDERLWATCAREEFSRRGYLKGDTNFDGKVDWDDAFVLTDHLFGGGNEDFVASEAADVTFSDDLNISDLVLLISYLSGETETLPGDSPRIIDTLSSNLITGVSINPTLTVPTPFKFNYGGFTDVPEGTTAGDIGKRFHPLSTSTLHRIVWPDQVSDLASGNFEYQIGGTLLMNQVQILSSLYSNDITTRENKNLDTTGELFLPERAVLPGGSTVGDLSDHVRTTIMWFQIGMGVYFEGNSQYYTTWGHSLNGNIPPPESLFLPWLEGTFPDHNISVPVDFSITSRKFLYSFNPSEIPSYVDRAFIWFVLSISNSRVGSGEPAMGYEYGTDGTRPGNRHYRPEVHLLNLSDSDPGILPNVTYIAETFADIPGGFETDHRVAEPSGPDQWFIRFAKIVNGEGDTFSQTSIPDYFRGFVRHRLVTEGVNLEAGTTYELNIAFLVKQGPQVHQTTLDVYTEQFSTGTTHSNYVMKYRMSVPPNVFVPQTITFTTGAVFDPVYMTNAVFYIEFTEEHDGSFEKVNSNEVIISDINIVHKVSGKTANIIYQYNGQSWTRTRTSIIDPNTEEDIPRTGLVDSWDSQSNEYQLYCHGGGRAWVWHYDGGLYSGSALGARYDRRPQIVNIV